MDSEILKAVSNIVQRAERMIDDAKIQSTYERNRGYSSFK